MLIDALNRIIDLSQLSCQPIIKSTGPDQEMLVYPDGRHLVIDLAKRPTYRRMDFSASFLEYVAGHGSQASEVFVGDSVVFLESEGNAIDVTYMELTPSGFFRTFCDGDARWMNQRELISMLRVHTTCENAQLLLSSIRAVSFTRRSDGTSKVQHGKESLGRSVEAVVQSTDQIPEQLVFNEPLFTWNGFDSATSIKMNIEIDVEEQRFRCYPAANEVEFARNVVFRRIAETIHTEQPEVPVYIGNRFHR